MSIAELPPGRRERAKQQKQDRIMMAARTLFAEHGIGGVTTQQIADRADVAIGTLYLYASTKAELLIMVQNVKFAAAIDEGIAAADLAGASVGVGVVETLMELMRPVVTCVREQRENGRTYLHELVFGDPNEPHRGAGLSLAFRLEAGFARLLADSRAVSATDANSLARVITAVLHISVTATVFLDLSDDSVLDDIRRQIDAILTPHHHATAQGASS
jgi:AcrR family transcriptional regulator